ncbi:hypothetical protein T07_9002, partial [Trichinella nelsoni]
LIELPMESNNPGEEFLAAVLSKLRLSQSVLINTTNRPQGSYNKNHAIVLSIDQVILTYENLVELAALACHERCQRMKTSVIEDIKLPHWIVHRFMKNLNLICLRSSTSIYSAIVSRP